MNMENEADSLESEQIMRKRRTGSSSVGNTTTGAEARRDAFVYHLWNLRHQRALLVPQITTST